MTTNGSPNVMGTLDRLKLLLWRLDLFKRTFTNLNNCPAILLSTENYRFFKDRNFRHQLLHPDDRTVLEQAIDGFKERKPVQALFRIPQDNRLHWFRLSGWPSDDPRYYDGAVEEISDQIPSLKNIFSQQTQQLLEQAGVPYPVALFDWPSCLLRKANLSFVDLLNLNSARKQKTRLADLLQGEINLPLLLESLLSEQQLTTELQLRTSWQNSCNSNCRLEYFQHAGQSYLRLAVLEQFSSTSPVAPQDQRTAQITLKQLCKDLHGCGSIDSMLERIYQAKGLFPGMDVIMFSDIYARKNKVVVYAKGEMKEPLESGSQFPYSGTIAENIEKENLEFLIVEDTQSSIKAIDWMLFVPKGLGSYIAKACYERGAMRTVLILCSQQKHCFSEQQVASLTSIASTFHKQLKKIRRHPTLQ